MKGLPLGRVKKSINRRARFHDKRILLDVCKTRMLNICTYLYKQANEFIAILPSAVHKGE